MRRALLAVLVLSAGPLHAQAAMTTPPPGISSAAARAAATITSGDVKRRIGIIADDSMLGRDTPSRGLELTAAYVASQFHRYGLKPGGDRGGYLQRYSITRRRFDAARSRVAFHAGKVDAVATFDRTARYVQGEVAGSPVTGPVVLVGGRLSPAAVGRMRLRDRIVLYALEDAAPSSDKTARVARALRLAAPKAIVMSAPVEAERFAARIPQRAPGRLAVDLKLVSPPLVEVSEATIAPVLQAAGVDLAAVRTDTGAVYRELPAVSAQLELRDSILETLTAPNAVGILEGSDPALRHEYLVYSAHMDHIGVSPGQADSINNGADDDASGTTGVVELAEAFSRPGARPKRSVIFLTVSGEEKGLWGSRYFTEHPPVPIDHIVADLNIDMIGRNWRDTIVAIGKEHSDLGPTLERVNAAHPELGMTAIDDRWPEERFYFRSDHYNFARKGVPILFFFNGVHVDYHKPSDSPDKIDSEKESRILRLLYYLGREVGDAPERPRWNPSSYHEIVDDPSASR